MTPAIPFAASTTTRSGPIASTSTNERTLETKLGQTSSPRTVPRAVADRPACAHVVDDRRAGNLLEHRLGEKRGDEVARDELAGVVDEEAAVGVAVEGDAEVGLLLQDFGHDELAVLGQKRVRLVVGEAAVGLEETGHRLDRQALEDRREHRSGHPVGGVDHDAQRPHGRGVDEGQHLVDEAWVDIALLNPPGRLTP